MVEFHYNFFKTYDKEDYDKFINDFLRFLFIKKKYTFYQKFFKYYKNNYFDNKKKNFSSISEKIEILKKKEKTENKLEEEKIEKFEKIDFINYSLDFKKDNLFPEILKNEFSNFFTNSINFFYRKKKINFQNFLKSEILNKFFTNKNISIYCQLIYIYKDILFNFSIKKYDQYFLTIMNLLKKTIVISEEFILFIYFLLNQILFKNDSFLNLKILRDFNNFLGNFLNLNTNNLNFEILNENLFLINLNYFLFDFICDLKEFEIGNIKLFNSFSFFNIIIDQIYKHLKKNNFKIYFFILVEFFIHLFSDVFFDFHNYKDLDFLENDQIYDLLIFIPKNKINILKKFFSKNFISQYKSLFQNNFKIICFNIEKIIYINLELIYNKNFENHILKKEKKSKLESIKIKRNNKLSKLFYFLQNKKLFLNLTINLFLNISIRNLKQKKWSIFFDENLFFKFINFFEKQFFFNEIIILIQFSKNIFYKNNIQIFLEKIEFFDHDYIQYIFEINLIEEILRINFLKWNDKILEKKLIDRISSYSLLRAKTQSGYLSVQLSVFYKFFFHLNFMKFLNVLDN